MKLIQVFHKFIVGSKTGEDFVKLFTAVIYNYKHSCLAIKDYTRMDVSEERQILYFTVAKITAVKMFVVLAREYCLLSPFECGIH